MKIVAEHPKSHKEPQNCYELILCPACFDITLQSYYWDESHMLSPENISYTTLYPSESKKILGLPPKIQKAYDAARKVKHIDINAYAVLVGRTLEMICEDRNASGKTLNEKLLDLSEKGEIPSKLVKVTENIRHFRNIGAHADVKNELTQSDEPMISSLFIAILEYVYGAPYLVQQAEYQLRKLKKPNLEL